MNLFSTNGALSFLAGGSGTTETPQRLSRAQAIHRENERSSFTIITKVILRRLIEDAMNSSNRLIEGDSQTLSDLLMILERVLFHGFKSSMKNALFPLRTPDAELWTMIVKVGRINETLKDSISCIDRLDKLTTPISKIRGIFRLTMMQKKLNDFFESIINLKFVKDFYETWSYLRHEEAIALCGGLLGLRVIEFDLVLEYDSLQDQPLSIDFANYMKLPTVATGEDDNNDKTGIEKKQMEKERKTLLDQNSYLEERIRQLETNLEEAKRKFELTQEVKSEVQFNSFKGVSYRPSDDSEDLEPAGKVGKSTFEMDKEISQLKTENEALATKVVELEDTIGLTEQQVGDKTRVCTDLYEKLRLSEECIRKLEGDFIKLKDHYNEDKQALCNRMEQLQEKNEELTNKLKTKFDSDDSLRNEFQKKCDQYSSSITLLETKQNVLSMAEDRVRVLEQELSSAKKELPSLREENKELKEKLKSETQRAEESEQALEELGKGLSESKLRMVELTEELLPLSDAQWANDSDVHNCNNCAELFTLTKRKHHCRKCGSIFCSSCSEGRIKLPSNPKPARVCDSCFIIIQKMPRSPGKE